MEAKHTPGNWKVGKTGGVVVSDQPLPGYDINGGHDHIEYYGGHLIAESIWRKEDARLIAAAPDLLNALGLALEYWADRQQRYRNRAPVWVQEARAAIAKATREAQS
jgi:hypothetical protein